MPHLVFVSEREGKGKGGKGINVFFWGGRGGRKLFVFPPEGVLFSWGKVVGGGGGFYPLGGGGGTGGVFGVGGSMSSWGG